MAFKARPPSTFSPSSSDYNAFSEWRREFETYMAVTTFFTEDVNVPIQQARLYNLAGQEFARFVRQHVTVNNDTTVTNILDEVGNVLKPRRYDLRNREKLFSHKQAQSSAAKYLEELRELYDLSNYGENITKEQLIRDLFIAGITSNEARCIIFQQDSETVTTEQCLHLVSSFESVNSSSNVSTTYNHTECSVNSISRQGRGWRCYGCGSTTQHLRSQCPAYKMTCHKCQKIGHFAKVCKSHDTSKTINSINSIEDTTINSLRVNVIRQKSVQRRRTIPITINGKSIPSALIDSGSDITVLSRKLCRKTALPYKNICSSPKVTGANGDSINLVGCIENACIETKEGYFLDTVWVAEHLPTGAILGQTSLSSFNALQINYGGHLPTLNIQELVVKSSVFADCTPVSCFPVKPSTPIRAPSRRHSLEDTIFLKTEIKKLIQEGKIQASNSPWRSQLRV